MVLHNWCKKCGFIAIRQFPDKTIRQFKQKYTFSRKKTSYESFTILSVFMALIKAKNYHELWNEFNNCWRCYFLESFLTLEPFGTSWSLLCGGLENVWNRKLVKCTINAYFKIFKHLNMPIKNWLFIGLYFNKLLNQSYEIIRLLNT